MTERLSRLRRWWESARSTYVSLRWEGRFWILFAIVGVIWHPLATSIPVLFFISCWANVKGAMNQAQQAKREMLEEEADEAEA